MNNILNYFGLAAAVLGSVSGLQSLFKQPTISGPGIVAAIQPVLMTLPGVLPHLQIPGDLVNKVADAVAEAINDYFKPKQVE